ncbi:hypothetical protein [Sulfurimonas sp.]
MEKNFIDEIKIILEKDFGKKNSKILFDKPLIQYLVKKTKSANKGSKSRGSFANLYAIYVLIEDYLNQGFHKDGNDYSDYDGAIFTNLFTRQRELPFGAKLQNHAYQGRLNEDFKKYFPTVELIPLLRDTKVNRYWINENLLLQKVGNKNYNLAKVIIKIINKYIESKEDALSSFINTCNNLKVISKTEKNDIYDFIKKLLDYNVDARLFEIVSYSILKYYYNNITVYFGFELDNLSEESLQLYKTGRTNANDGGIDFVMKPLGRFFQVTETTDFKKYFLDIDKIEKFPITFVVKTTTKIKDLEKEIKAKAYELYTVKKIVNKYIDSIEELINIEVLIKRFDECVKNGYLIQILDEIILQSKVEFNFKG